MPDIFRDLLFIHSDSAHEVAGRPEMHAPVFFAKILVTVEYLYCAPAFQEADQKAHALIRWYFKNLVNVIFLDICLSKESMPSLPLPVYYTPSIAIEYGSPAQSTEVSFD
ncbi:MAG: hypothetical protein M0P13_03745 [Fibrobacteraceae bacterium]|nr:hypothetical protein [Fibrobacteraceae bacterium]